MANSKQTIAFAVSGPDAPILPAVTASVVDSNNAGVLVDQQLIVKIGKAKPEIAHQIVQAALRSAATASTPNRAIDLLGDALLEVERLLALTRARVH